MVWPHGRRWASCATHCAMAIESERAALHAPLLRFAQLQLRNHSVAEDVVSETMLAIL